MKREDDNLMMEIAERYGDTLDRLAEKYGGYEKLGEIIGEILESINKDDFIDK